MGDVQGVRQVDSRTHVFLVQERLPRGGAKGGEEEKRGKNDSFHLALNNEKNFRSA